MLPRRPQVLALISYSFGPDEGYWWLVKTIMHRTSPYSFNYVFAVSEHDIKPSLYRYTWFVLEDIKMFRMSLKYHSHHQILPLSVPGG